MIIIIISSFFNSNTSQADIFLNSSYGKWIYSLPKFIVFDFSASKYIANLLYYLLLGNLISIVIEVALRSYKVSNITEIIQWIEEYREKTSILGYDLEDERAIEVIKHKLKFFKEYIEDIFTCEPLFLPSLDKYIDTSL